MGCNMYIITQAADTVKCSEIPVCWQALVLSFNRASDCLQILKTQGTALIMHACQETGFVGLWHLADWGSPLARQHHMLPLLCGG